MTGITIRGTGHYLPERIVENEEFTKIIDTSHEWIVSHTGVERRRMAVDEPTWYMGAKAAEEAVAAAGIGVDEIDVIIGTTVTADYRYPSMACLVQNHLGNTTAFCFDVAAACAGFTYALDMARRYLMAGDVKNILVVSAESLTQVTNFEDRSNCILFGDGAGASVLSAGDKSFGSYLRSDATGAGAIYAKHTRRKRPFFEIEQSSVHDQFHATIEDLTVMDGHEVFRFATRAMPEAIQEACKRAGIAPADLDLIIPHQANIRIIKSAMRYLKIPMEKAYVNIQEYGNTSSATCQICLDECVRSGRLKRGDKFCVVGFGSGLVYGACVMEY